MLQSPKILTPLAGAIFSFALAGPALANCPDWQLNGIFLNQDADTAWVPQSFQVMAGGALNHGQCATIEGYGYMTAAPNFTINYDDRAMGRDLEFRVDGSCDTVLLINDATAQWHFNDDEDGTLNPRLRLAAAGTGVYDVWVGTFGSNTCQATLTIETFPPGAAPAQGLCPDWSLGGADIQLSGGAAEMRDVVAGGSVNLFATECGVGGHGYVAQAPDFSLYFTPGSGGETLSISATGECDTVLLVNDPTTNWLFNDDFDGFDPRIEVAGAAAGRYDIWVGTYGSDLCRATMSVSASAQGGAGGLSK
jgi:hypothetical protein